MGHKPDIVLGEKSRQTEGRVRAVRNAEQMDTFHLALTSEDGPSLVIKREEDEQERNDG